MIEYDRMAYDEAKAVYVQNRLGYHWIELKRDGTLHPRKIDVV